MSAWSKQAIPLLFLGFAKASLETALKENPHNRALNRIMARVEKWTDCCWTFLKKDPTNVSKLYAEKKVSNAATEMHLRLKSFWKDVDIQTQTEIPNAMLVVAVDVFESMPKNNKERYRIWRYLVRALFDLCLLIDPELADNVGQERGLAISSIVMHAVK